MSIVKTTSKKMKSALAQVARGEMEPWELQNQCVALAHNAQKLLDRIGALEKPTTHPNPAIMSEEV